MSEPQPHIQEPRGPEIAEPKQEEQAQLGPLQRFIGVLLSPGETFADINRKPNWLLPILIGIIVSIGMVSFYDFVIKPDWLEMTRLQFQRAPAGRTPPPEQFPIIAKFTEISILVGSVLGPPILYLIVSGVVALGMLLMQAQTTFKKILSVVAWSFCAPGLIQFALIVVVASVRGFGSLKTLSFQKLSTISATNLGVALGSNAPPALRALASSIDLFIIWVIVLLILGLTAISGSRRITKGKVAALVLVLWGIAVAIGIVAAVAGIGG